MVQRSLAGGRLYCRMWRKHPFYGDQSGYVMMLARDDQLSATPAGQPAGHVVLDISGMTCAACAGRVEGALGKVPGVARAEVNLVLERADVALKSDGASTDALISAVARAGYGAHSRGGTAGERKQAEEQREVDAQATERHDLVL